MTQEQKDYAESLMLKGFVARFNIEDYITLDNLAEIEPHYTFIAHQGEVCFKSKSSAYPNINIPIGLFEDKAKNSILWNSKTLVSPELTGSYTRPTSKAEFDRQYLTTFNPTNSDQDGIINVDREIDNLKACFNSNSSSITVGSADLNQVMYAFNQTRKVLETYRNKVCQTCIFKRDTDINDRPMSEEIFCTWRGKCEPKDFGCNRHADA